MFDKSTSNSNISTYDAYDCFKNKSLHIFHLSIKTLHHENDVLKLITKRSDAAVISLSKTWLYDFISNGDILVPGYHTRSYIIRIQ